MNFNEMHFKDMDFKNKIQIDFKVMDIKKLPYNWFLEHEF